MGEGRKLKKGLYTHFKGKDKVYEVIGEATHTETGEKLVIYKALYSDGHVKENDIFARPYEMFLEQVPEGRANPTNQKYRFEYIEDSSDYDY